jgi:glutathione S-transferase
MIRLLEFHRSSNCAKVRIALNYKGIPFEAEEMSAADRTPMIQAANWPLVPVILDGDVTMRDSEAILHYLESNYREGPSLTPETREEIHRAEGLCLTVQQRLRPQLRRVYGEALKPAAERSAGVMADVRKELGPALEPLEEALAGKAFLLGERMTMYDILLACALMPARARPEYVAQSPLWAFFHEELAIPEDLPNVRRWADAVLAYDGVGAQAAAGPPA